MLRTVPLNLSIVARMEPFGGVIRENVVTNPDYAVLHPGYGLHSCVTSVNSLHGMEAPRTL